MQARRCARGDGDARGSGQHPGRSGDRRDGQEASQIRELVSALRSVNLPTQATVLISVASRFDSRPVLQLVGAYRPEGRGSGGKQDGDCDQEPEGHHPHPGWRGEEPAGQLDERVRLADRQTGAFPGLHVRYVGARGQHACPLLLRDVGFLRLSDSQFNVNMSEQLELLRYRKGSRCSLQCWIAVIGFLSFISLRVTSCPIWTSCDAQRR